MTVQDFVNKYNGVHIDEDGYYGAQCWDLSARYAREVVGCPSFPTVTGGAAGLFSNTADIILQYFDRIANNPNDANQVPPDGAVIVWGTTWSPPYGHTAVKVSGGVGQNMTVIEQNGNNPGGAAYLKQRNYTGVTGWLVPKKGTDMADKVNVDTSRILRHGILGRNGLVGRAYGLDGSDQPDHFEPWVGADLTNQFIQDVFLSPEGRQWRDSADDNSINGINRRIGEVGALKGQTTELQTKLDEAVKVTKIKDGEIERLNVELEKAKVVTPTEPGDKPSTVDLTISQAIKVLVQTIKNAIKG